MLGWATQIPQAGAVRSILYASYNRVGWEVMGSHMKVWLVAVFGLTLISVCAGSPANVTSQQPRDDDSGAPANVWGGNAAVLTVSARGAAIDFECANGTIKERLDLNSGSRFRAKGTYTAERAGPTLKDQNSGTVEAVYAGTVERDRMQLQVFLAGEKSPSHSYELVRGHYGNLTGCK